MTNTDAPTNTTMRAIVQDRYGSAEVLRLARVARPQIAEDGVLVHVHAAGLDRGTWHMMAGQPYLLRVLEGKLARKPANVTFDQAAVVPISAGTALQALTDAGKVGQGQRVLIIGASGGVGSYAVQLAKAIGTEVTGVCSTAKLDFVRSLGADHAVDYTRQDFADGANT